MVGGPSLEDLVIFFEAVSAARATGYHGSVVLQPTLQQVVKVRVGCERSVAVVASGFMLCNLQNEGNIDLRYLIQKIIGDSNTQTVADSMPPYIKKTH